MVIPNSVTNIGDYAFSYCSGLKSVTCHAQNVPDTENYTFSVTSLSSATLYVSSESVNAYKSTSPWSSFGTILPITPTAVESLIADEVSDEAGYTAIYDFQGRRLHEKPAHGFYIQGGKKYFVK